MPATDTKRVVNAVGVLFIVIAVVVAMVILILHTRRPAPMTSVNYSHNICDDAYKTAISYAKVNPEFIDYDLQDVGCFSGFMELPDAWRTWQTQFRPGGGWVAEWYAGWEEPTRPYSAEQVNGGQFQLGNNLPSKRVRLEGSGTIRIYRITDNSQ